MSLSPSPERVCLCFGLFGWRKMAPIGVVWQNLAWVLKKMRENWESIFRAFLGFD
jgi:hypothetical protein